MEAKIIFKQIDADGVAMITAFYHLTCLQNPLFKGSGSLDEDEFMRALSDWGMDRNEHKY